MVDIYDILHGEFDIELHRNNFKNYLEVIILPDGKVEYAVPSHQEKLIKICMDKFNVTREELNSMCPEEFYLDFMTWLCEKSRCISVWTNFYRGAPNSNQLSKLKLLHSEGLYLGEVEMDYTRYYRDCIRNLDLDQPFYVLSDREVHVVYCLQQMLEHNYTLRKAQDELCVPKSTLHKWIHNDIKHISIEMYDSCKTLMRSHIKRKY